MGFLSRFLRSWRRFDATAQLNHKLGPVERGEVYEDPLDAALLGKGFGETDGGGTLLSAEGEIQYIDVEMWLVSIDDAVPFVVEFLEAQGAPRGSTLKVYRGDDMDREVPFGRREGFGIYLDGVTLPDAVYAECDSNVVVAEIDKRLVGHGEVEAHWQGPRETALYVYGDANAEMQPLIADFLAAYPLCQGARMVDLTPRGTE